MSVAALIARALDAPSPYYRAALGEEPFDGLAPTRREQLLADQLAHLPHGTRRFADAPPPVRAGATGSGNSLLVLTFTADDLARERAAGVRMLRELEAAPGMRVANALRGALTTPGSLLFGDVVDEYGCLDVPLGFPESAAAATQAWTLIDRVEPGMLVLDGEGALPLFAAAPARARPWLRGLLWCRVAGRDFPPPPCPDSLGFSGWQRTWLAVPEATSFVASSCAEGTLHLDSGLWTEVLTAAGIARFGRGRLLLTPLGVDTPVLRYETELTVALDASACTCGRSGGMTIL